MHEQFQLLIRTVRPQFLPCYLQRFILPHHPAFCRNPVLVGAKNPGRIPVPRLSAQAVVAVFLFTKGLREFQERERTEFRGVGIVVVDSC